MSDGLVSCASCGKAMRCEPEGACWCKDLPPRKLLGVFADCLCPACFERESRHPTAEPSAVPKAEGAS